MRSLRDIKEGSVVGKFLKQIGRSPIPGDVFETPNVKFKVLEKVKEGYQIEFIKFHDKTLCTEWNPKRGVGDKLTVNSDLNPHTEASIAREYKVTDALGKKAQTLYKAFFNPKLVGIVALVDFKALSKLKKQADKKFTLKEGKEFPTEKIITQLKKYAKECKNGDDYSNGRGEIQTLVAMALEKKTVKNAKELVKRLAGIKKDGEALIDDLIKAKTDGYADSVVNLTGQVDEIEHITFFFTKAEGKGAVFEDEEKLEENELFEALRKKVLFRNGKRMIKKKSTKSGYKSVGGKEKRMSHSEKKKRALSQIKGARKRKATKSKANRKRKKSMRKREMSGL